MCEPACSWHSASVPGTAAGSPPAIPRTLAAWSASSRKRGGGGGAGSDLQFLGPGATVSFGTGRGSPDLPDS